MEFRITFNKIMIGDEVKSSHQFSKYTFIYWLQDNLIIEKKTINKNLWSIYSFYWFLTFQEDIW